MSNQSPDAAPPEPTDVRFSMRALLIWTIPVALIAAALGPYFRAMAPADRLQVGTLWGVCITLAAVWIGYHARTRFRLERAAGRKLLELPTASRHVAGPTTWFAYVGGALLIGFGIGYLFLAANDLERQQNVFSQLYDYLFFGVIGATGIAHGIVMIWWNRTVQLREHGVLRGLRLLRWDHTTDCRWSQWTDMVSFEGVDQRHRDARFDMRLPASHVKAAHAILTDKLARLLDSQAAGDLPTGTGAPAAFQLTTGRENTARGCLFSVVIFHRWRCCRDPIQLHSDTWFRLRVHRRILGRDRDRRIRRTASRPGWAATSPLVRTV